ncbi:MAG: sugar transferase [Phycisphaeraceae bacterium]|nr:sugar transferase [Phycisphaeraceae bacterium]
MTLKPVNPLALQSRATDAPLVRALWYLLGVTAMVGLATAAAYDITLDRWIGQAWVMIVASVAAFLVAGFFIDRAMRYPGTRSGFTVVPIVIVCFLSLSGLLLASRSYYSRSYVAVAFAVTLLWALLRFYARRKDRSMVLAVVPAGDTTMLSQVPHVTFMHLHEPTVDPLMSRNGRDRARLDGVVADLHAPLDASWTRFLADCAMRQLPVYHAASVYEAATGRVSLTHFSEIHLSNAEPPPLFGPLKRLMDIGLCLLILPVALPLMILSALAIRLDSKGPALFWQPRVGQGGRVFRMVKFRTMRHEPQDNTARFAARGDDRITRVGRFLRSTRLDELPQLWNILKGDMSLVGPRPEQVAFVQQFEREIPFYGLRHFVRPGVTGWAQIGSGYASDVKGTIEKLEHDFYYIKYRSIALDIYILYRTVKTVATGSGAR